eukprot:gene10423-9556_t
MDDAASAVNKKPDFATAARLQQQLDELLEVQHQREQDNEQLGLMHEEMARAVANGDRREMNDWMGAINGHEMTPLPRWVLDWTPPTERAQPHAVAYQPADRGNRGASASTTAAPSSAYRRADGGASSNAYRPPDDKGGASSGAYRKQAIDGGDEGYESPATPTGAAMELPPLDDGANDIVDGNAETSMPPPDSPTAPRAYWGVRCAHR